MKLSRILKRLRECDNRNDPLCKIAGSRSTTKEIIAWIKKAGLSLPEDYQEFLTEIGGCNLHQRTSDVLIRLLDLSQIEPVGPLVLGDDCDDVPGSWYAIADLNDGNYTVMDLSDVKGSTVDIIDGFHETLPYEATIIARSFTEFLERAIEDPEFSVGGGNGRQFWKKFDCYGDKGLR